MSKSHPSQNPSALPALAFRDVEFDVIDRNGKRWLQAAQIAKALGYACEDAVSRIYRRSSDEFSTGMTETVKLTASGNLQKEARIFSLRGAHLLAMFARTEVARDFRRWVLDVLDAEVAGPAAPSAPVPAPAAYASPEFVALRYQGKALRVTRMAGGFWYGSHGLARALGERDNARINYGLRGEAQLRVVPCRGRTLAVINQAAMLEAVGGVPVQIGQPFLRWLSAALAARFGAEAPALPAPANAPASVTGEGRQLALEYFARCRTDMAAAGVADPGWDREAGQRIADDMAALLVQDRRWLLTFADGAPRLQVVEPGAVLVRLDDTGQLASLIRDAVPADALPLLLEVGVRRLGGMAARGGPSGGAGSEFAN